MNRVLFNYLFTGYSKTVLKVIMIAYCFVVILNLFEEIEFIKNSSSPILIPMSLTALYVPNIVIKLMPFIIFISSMWFLLRLRDSSDLLSMKIFGVIEFSARLPNAIFGVFSLLILFS